MKVVDNRNSMKQKLSRLKQNLQKPLYFKQHENISKDHNKEIKFTKLIIKQNNQNRFKDHNSLLFSLYFIFLKTRLKPNRNKVFQEN